MVFKSNRGTCTIRKKDFTEVVERIAQFRRRLAQFTQREDEPSDELYSLQISFFPLSEDKRGEA